jgi:hypothetical protein
MMIIIWVYFTGVTRGKACHVAVRVSGFGQEVWE